MGKDLYNLAQQENSPLAQDNHILQRNRLHQDDPSAGFGYTASQGLRGANGEQYFTPNQELNLPRGQDQAIAPQADLKVTDASGTARTIATRGADGKFVLSPDLPPQERQYYEGLIQQQQAKVAALRQKLAQNGGNGSGTTN
jgi:hypothetical protein